MNLTLETIKNNFPFISVFSTNEDGTIIYGIVLNSDKNTISMIDLNSINDKQKIVELMKIGENWWWYSDRDIPINLFYYNECLPYMEYVLHIPAKSVSQIFGSNSSLTYFTNNKKIFRKNKTLKVIRDQS